MINQFVNQTLKTIFCLVIFILLSPYCQSLDFTSYNPNSAWAHELTSNLASDWPPRPVNSDPVDTFLQKPQRQLTIQIDASVFMLSASSVSALAPFLFGLIYDLRKRQQAEFANRKSDARMLAVMDSTAQAVLCVDSVGACSFCNKTAMELLGYENEVDLLGQRVHNFIYPTSDKDHEYAHSRDCGTCQVCNEGSQVHVHHTQLWKKNGTSFPAELWARPIVVEENVEGGVVTFIDITARLDAQQKNIRTAQLASIGELSASVAHEINNPIAGVINYSQILLNKQDLNENQIELISRVQKEGNRVADIVHNLLNYSRDSKGEKNQHDIRQIIKDSLVLINPQLTRKGISVDFEWPKHLPTIKCNTQQIEQVLINIFRNAQHALEENNPHDRRIIISGCAAQVHKQEYLLLTIANNGPGIPESFKKKILEPFMTTKPMGIGTGLGLSISATIMKEHEGELEVQSEPDGLTKMILRFPIGEHSPLV